MSEGRDIIVVGGSAGGIEAASDVLRGIPPTIPAALFIVIHSAQNSPSFIADILSRSAPLPVRYAEDREPIELGKIYVAPTDRHLIIKPGEMRVIRGPKENNFRPAIDPLFRSAAYTYGPRVIGVVLSGLLDDGAHGAQIIKRQGGATVAQAPEDAQQPSMPLAAIERVGVDRVLAAESIGPALIELASSNGHHAGGPQGEQTDVAEGAVSALRLPGNEAPSSPFICPDCGGSLWEISDGNLLRYRCHEGHGFTADTLNALQDVELEQALWTSVRLMEEQAELQRRMAHKWHAAGNHWLRLRFTDNAEDKQRAANLIREVLTLQPHHGRVPSGANLRHEYNLD
ncbi:MAG: chemotaxis protein CheB [Pirellulales bacterium]|nr:chemotaxis protein CheB [Pirellulales bacterium]